MGQSYQNWKTAIEWIQHLANPEIHYHGGHLQIVLEDLDTTDKWQLQVRDVVGYKVTRDFGTKRLSNTFVIMESTWISALHREPMIIPGHLDAVRHYLIETMAGAIEVLSKEEPSISKAGMP